MNKIYAHRGASRECPENTIAAFTRALDLGCAGIELDVHLSKDGHCVVMHDETVDRTTDGSGALAEMTLAEIQRLDAGNGERVPILDDVLDLVGDRLRVDIEVKANAAGSAVLDVLTDRNTDWLISSFDWDVLRYVRSQNDRAELWVLTVAATDSAINAFHELDAGALAIGERSLDADITTMLRERNIPFWPWTVNNPDRAQELLEQGALGICTDQPRLMLEQLGE